MVRGDMLTIREMGWEAVALELEAETPIGGPTFTADDIVAMLWEWNHEELRAAGVSREDVRPVVLEVLDHIEAHGWDMVREELQRGARMRSPEPDEEAAPRPRGPADAIDPPF